jgi:hypothetical protein
VLLRVCVWGDGWGLDLGLSRVVQPQPRLFEAALSSSFSVPKRGPLARETASKTDVMTILSCPHHASSAPCSSTPSLQSLYQPGQNKACDSNARHVRLPRPRLPSLPPLTLPTPPSRGVCWFVLADCGDAAHRQDADDRGDGVSVGPGAASGVPGVRPRLLREPAHDDVQEPHAQLLPRAHGPTHLRVSITRHPASTPCRSPCGVRQWCCPLDSMMHSYAKPVRPLGSSLKQPIRVLSLAATRLPQRVRLRLQEIPGASTIPKQR